MNPRAIWQGTLKVKQHELPVKLYAAVQDQNVHFHLLHKRDRLRVQQRMVDSQTERPVPAGEARKAFEAEPGRFVAVTSEDLEQSAPAPSRHVSVSRFVPASAIDARLYDRPYYLGPAGESTTDYFALAQALGKKKRIGIVAWVMRKHSYVGALLPLEGYLVLITLRHADEIVPLAELPAPEGATFGAKEKSLAEQLIEALSGEFDPDAYHDEYQQRLHNLIEAKRHGKKVTAKRAPRRRQAGSLADSLEKSLRGVRASS